MNANVKHMKSKTNSTLYLILYLLLNLSFLLIGAWEFISDYIKELSLDILMYIVAMAIVIGSVFTVLTVVYYISDGIVKLFDKLIKK